MPHPKRTSALPVGWREWVALPGLGIDGIKAKIDTGARTSAIHAFAIVEFERRGAKWLRFELHPLQRSTRKSVVVEAPLVEYRQVRSSTGQATRRAVIATEIVLGRQRWTIELTLASRDQMGFRMLLGRQALRGRCTVDPGRSYLASERR